MQTNNNLIFEYNKEVFGGTEYLAKRFHETVLPIVPNFNKYNCIILPGYINLDLNDYINDDKEIILWLHNTTEQFNENITVNAFYKKEFTDKIKYVVVVSEFAKKEFIEKTHIDPNKVVVIYNAIDPIKNDINRFKNVKTVEILHTSAQERGFWVLLLALKYAKEDFNLRIYNKVYSDNITTSKDYKNLLNDKRIYMHGHTSRKVLNDSMSKAHIFVYPSIFEETFCLSQVEALSANCLSIYNDLGALKEVSLGYGIIYDGEVNKEKHAKKIAEMIDESVRKVKSNKYNPALQSEEINNKFSWENFKNSWIELNEKI